MATYNEIYRLHNESELINKVTVACIVAAETIMGEVDTTPNHENRLTWAASVFGNPKNEAERMYWAILAANVDLTVIQITGATDSAIQTQVNAHVDLFATGQVRYDN